MPIVGDACDWNDSRFVPSELIGVWRTDDARYRGRAIELGKDSAVIETGRDQASTESVESVKIQPAGKETTYSLRCRPADGSRHVLTLRFSPSGGVKYALVIRRISCGNVALALTSPPRAVSALHSCQGPCTKLTVFKIIALVIRIRISKGADESFWPLCARYNLHPGLTLRITIPSRTVSQPAALISSPSFSRSWALASLTTK